MLTPEQKKRLDEKILLTKAKRLGKAQSKLHAHRNKQYIRSHMRVISRLRRELDAFIRHATQTHGRVQKVLSKIEKEYAS